MSVRPLFSIIVPTHNRPAELIRALRSVDRQTLRDFELLVVDDGSTEGDAVAALDEVRCSQKRLLTHANNRGVAAARNTGIVAAKGALLAFLDDDDEYSYDFLEVAAAAMSDPNAWAAACWSPITSYVQPVAACAERDDVSLFSAFVSAGAGCGLVVKSDCMRTIGGFHEFLRIGEDTEFFVRFLANGYRPRQLPSNLVRIAKNSHGSLTVGASRELRQNVCRWIKATYADFLTEHPHLRDHLVQGGLSGASQTRTIFGVPE